MDKKLEGLRVAVLATDGVERREWVEPRKALEEAGAVAKLVSPAKGLVQAYNHFEKGDQFMVDVPLAEADAGRFDALPPAGARA